MVWKVAVSVMDVKKNEEYTNSGVDRRLQHHPRCLNCVHCKAFERLLRLLTLLVQLHANVAAWPTVLVRAVQKALAHAKLSHEIFALLLLATTCLGVFNRAFLAVDHDIVVNVHFLCPPVDRRNEHDESRVNVPLPRTQESQEERIRVIVLDHAPEGLSQFLGLLRSESLLELLSLTVLVIPTLGSTASIVLVLTAEKLHTFRLGLLVLGRGVRRSRCVCRRGGAARMCAFGCYAKDFERLRPHLLQLRLLVRREVARPSGRHLRCHHVGVLLRLERKGVVVFGCVDCRRLILNVLFGVSVYDECGGGGEAKGKDESSGFDGGALWSRKCCKPRPV